MNAHVKYKSFVANKTIEELQYQLLQYNENLHNLGKEIGFLRHMMNADIFKSETMNLFENLELFKDDLKTVNNIRISLIEETVNQMKQIRGKIECEDLVCDAFFTEEYELLESKIHTFLIKAVNLKLKIIEYLQGVIKT